MARELADLPYARHLEPSTDLPRTGGEYDCAHFDGQHLDEQIIQSARFAETAFTSLTIDHGSLRHSAFNDVWLHNVRWVGTDAGDTSWRDAEFVAGAMSGLDLGGADLRRVRFEGCKLDSVNFRTATLQQVSFVDCVLRHVDFGDARLTGVSFDGSTINRLVMNRARLAKTDFRGAVEIDIAEGIDGMKGAKINPRQLLSLAPTFAAALGITVEN
ncbi:pentapeptide repeat-containing protein [Nocardia huaxiensis]|uniref:Pentapeptide repeat-containing protein n=1 Tax=Nocardia huaxiensis TaxID=2755382 RepID=A0A7D6ZEZ8_9NOCA|nr:pentapeptide repeat-containing protein [Nocardia huaxiensis]QLY33908.1 pentapeptide repeat-containing protein [Nocardia huaxiensis]UFS99157.1 pentapeptide repeat-containing protein [Nocardia huaxiensis]